MNARLAPADGVEELPLPPPPLPPPPPPPFLEEAEEACCLDGVDLEFVAAGAVVEAPADPVAVADAAGEGVDPGGCCCDCDNEASFFFIRITGGFVGV